MSTKIRAEVSGRNKYYISKHRYYELKHFCLQYPEWKELSLYFGGLIKDGFSPVGNFEKQFQNPVLVAMERRLYFEERIKAIENAAIQADPDIASFILKAVTQDLSYVQLSMRYNMPCSRDMYYDRYRKFFYILSNSR